MIPFEEIRAFILAELPNANPGVILDVFLIVLQDRGRPTYQQYRRWWIKYHLNQQFKLFGPRSMEQRAKEAESVERRARSPQLLPLRSMGEPSTAGPGSGPGPDKEVKGGKKGKRQETGVAVQKVGRSQESGVKHRERRAESMEHRAMLRNSRRVHKRGPVELNLMVGSHQSIPLPEMIDGSRLPQNQVRSLS